MRSRAVRLERPTRSTTQRNDPFTSTYITEKPETQLEVFHTSEETGAGVGETARRVAVGREVTDRHHCVGLANLLARMSQAGGSADHRTYMNENSPQLTLALFSDAPTDELEAGHRVLIDVPALARQLGVTPRFVRRLIAERRVPFLKIGKFIRFDPKEIAQWVESQRVQVG